MTGLLRVFPDGVLPWHLDPDTMELVGVEARTGTFLGQYGIALERTGAVNGPLTRVSLADLAARAAVAAPTGVWPAAGLPTIFHVSRCGSTLLANAVSAARSTSCVIEAHCISDARFQSLQGSERPALPDLALAAIHATFARHGELCANSMLVKTVDFEVRDLDHYLANYHSNPIVAIVRDPVEVVASNLAVPSPWLRLPEEITGGFSAWRRPAGAEPDDELAIAALCWAESVEAMLAASDDRVLLIGYPDLMSDPVATVARVCEHLGLAVPPAPAILTETGYYAKSVAGAIRYEPDGEHHRPDLTRAEVERIGELVGPWPEVLDERLPGWR